MPIREALLRIGASYFSAVLAMTALFLLETVFYAGEWRGLGNAFLPYFLISAAAAIPVFSLVGVPYLFGGYQRFGKNKVLAFVLGGGGLGALSATLVVFPLRMSNHATIFFALAGFVAGAVSSFVWAKISKRAQDTADA